MARLLDLLIPGRRIEADAELRAARQASERRLAELRAQTRRLCRVIQQLLDEDRRRAR